MCCDQRQAWYWYENCCWRLHYELMTVPRSLVKPDCTLLSRHVGKADLVKEVLKEIRVTPAHWIYALMIKFVWLLTPCTLSIKWIKACMDQNRGWFSEGVHKSYWYKITKCINSSDCFWHLLWRVFKVCDKNTRKVPRCFKIGSETKIEKISRSNILATNQTKQSRTHFLMTANRNHLVMRNVEHFIAGNSITLTLFKEYTIANNHEEADTLIISCLCILNPIDAVVIIYSADTRVFVLLLKHNDIIFCKKIYMKFVSGFGDMTVLHQALRGIFATALLSLHCLTRCDTAGKFAGMSNEFWVQRIINVRNYQRLVH